MNRYIERALEHSPAHRNRITQVLMGTDGSVREAARAVGRFCRGNGLQDFPNPFPRNDERVANMRDIWDENFGAQPLEVGTLTPPVEIPDFTEMTKEEIEQFVIDRTGVNLKTSPNRSILMRNAREAIEAHNRKVGAAR